MPYALSLFWALWMMVAGMTQFVSDAPVGGANMDCIDGRAVVHIAQDAAITSYDHELVHAADCQDDGEMNGSFGPQTDPYITLPYCLQKVELPACVAQFTPWLFEDWLTATR